MTTQSQVLSKMSFELLNSKHPYKQRIRDYASSEVDYSSLKYHDLIEITKLYLSYIGGEDDIDISIPKKLAIKILSTGDFISFSKMFNDFEYERDEIVCKIIDKYSCDISEDIDEDIELLKDITSLQEDIESSELASVNE